MPSFDGEWWAVRALTVMGNAGVNLPGNALESGMAGLAAVEASTGRCVRAVPGCRSAHAAGCGSAPALKPLLDEMMACIVVFKPQGQHPLPAQSADGRRVRADRRDCNHLAAARGIDRTSHGFFFSRRKIDFGHHPPTATGFLNYANVPRLVGTLISAKLATLHELQTVYGVADAYNMLEVLKVDLHNQRVSDRAQRNRN
jgi:hypothetical protein